MANYAGEVLVPVDPGIFSIAGLGKLQEAVAEVVRYLDNRRLRIAGLVLTRAQNNNVSRDVEAQLRELFGELVHPTTIPHSVKIEEAHGRFVPVLDYAPRSAGAKAYMKLVEEIIANEQRTQDGAGAAPHGAVAADDADAA
jgi:chromosome partitioning protein